MVSKRENPTAIIGGGDIDNIKADSVDMGSKLGNPASGKEGPFSSEPRAADKQFHYVDGPKVQNSDYTSFFDEG